MAWLTSTWYVACGMWLMWRGHECQHPSTQGEGQGGDLRLVVGTQKSDVKLNRHTGDYSYDKSHVFELAITILILY